MASSLARSAHNATNSLHSLIYFAPEAERELTRVGLRAGQMCYFAGRAAPMGAVGSGVVAATFYNFNPDLVGRHIPAAWELASPDVVVGARFAAADAALTRLLGPDVTGSADMTALAEALRDAVSACEPEGRPLYAGHADLDWPDAPHLVMWHAVSLLREHRGDGHFAALAAADIDGCEAVVLRCAKDTDLSRDLMQPVRGWTDEQWDAAAARLAERGLTGEDGTMTAAGRAVHDAVEAATDQAAARPWDRIGPAALAEVADVLLPLAQACAAALPQVIPVGRLQPTRP